MQTKPNATFIISGDFNTNIIPMEFMNDLTDNNKTFQRIRKN